MITPQDLTQTLDTFHITASVTPADLGAIRSALVEYLIIEAFGPTSHSTGWHNRKIWRGDNTGAWVTVAQAEVLVQWAARQGEFDDVEHWQTFKGWQMATTIPKPEPFALMTPYMPMMVTLPPASDEPWPGLPRPPRADEKIQVSPPILGSVSRADHMHTVPPPVGRNDPQRDLEAAVKRAEANVRAIIGAGQRPRFVAYDENGQKLRYPFDGN